MLPPLQQLSKPLKPLTLRHHKPLPPHGPLMDIGNQAALAPSLFELNKDTDFEAINVESQMAANRKLIVVLFTR